MRSRGVWGEELVAKYLRDRHYEILAHSYRSRFGEIDLIAQKQGVIWFVEVKLRSSTEYGLPREFVDRRKQVKLRITAEAYLAQEELDCAARFDVAEVYADPSDRRKARIEYIENAF